MHGGVVKDAEVEEIEDSYSIVPIFPSVQDRYYSKYYWQDPNNKEGLDQVVLVHSNRVCLVSLAPKNPLLSGPSFSVDFQVTDKLDRLGNVARGKGKRGAQNLDPSANLCLIRRGEETFFVKSLVKGKLLEVNPRLIENPDILRSDPEGSGYIALVLPSLPQGLQDLKDRLLSPQEYFSSLN